jgi:hypothetical protein
LVRLGAGTTSFEPKTSPSHGGLTSADIAAAIGTVRNRKASLLVQAKYIDSDPHKFPIETLVTEYYRVATQHHRRVDTVRKIAYAAIKFYIRSPRCRTCRGGGEEWDHTELKFVSCQTCSGMGNKVPSNREIASLSGMSRSKVRDVHVRCFWEMHQILSTWEAVAAGQIKRALRK